MKNGIKYSVYRRGGRGCRVNRMTMIIDEAGGRVCNPTIRRRCDKF